MVSAQSRIEQLARAGVTQARIASLADVDAGQLSRWLAGAGMGDASIVRIVDVLRRGDEQIEPEPATSIEATIREQVQRRLNRHARHGDTQ